MIFTALPDEQIRINEIHKVRGGYYVLVRLTYTMIDKNNIDANGFFRELLLSDNLIDYDDLLPGGKNGQYVDSSYITDSEILPVKFKFYKVTNARGDKRFSLETIKKKAKDKLLNIGDLLYISTYKDLQNTTHMFFINLTHHTPTNEFLKDAIGMDAINTTFEEILPKLKDIMTGEKKWHDNSKGSGPIEPKDCGDTLEYLLGIKTNNFSGADINNTIELKSKSTKGTLDTLFTLRPCFENTRIAELEPNDKNRVSAFARYYGYESDNHPDCKSLYITIGSENAPQNNQGFFLEVDDINSVVNLIYKNPSTNKKEIACYWYFSDLKKQLELKHPATLWFTAEKRMGNNDTGQFKYTEIEFSRAPQFMTFITLIKDGIITYDWRGYISKSGPYVGKNHGNAWRIKPKSKSALFGEITQIKL